MASRNELQSESQAGFTIERSTLLPCLPLARPQCKVLGLDT
jgi:hypothetical protein